MPAPTTSAEATTTTTVAATTTTVLATTTTLDPTNLATAERFVDAFYSFDPEVLAENLQSAATGFIMFYQGWAQGANYQIVDRQACVYSAFASVDSVRCPVAVEDDFARTLDLGFNVTDQFHLTFVDGAIVGVTPDSNDPPKVERAFNWMFENKPDLFETGGACEDIFSDGPTPGECAAAFVAGFEEFVNSGR